MRIPKRRCLAGRRKLATNMTRKLTAEEIAFGLKEGKKYKIIDAKNASIVVDDEFKFYTEEYGYVNAYFRKNIWAIFSFTDNSFGRLTNSKHQKVYEII
jgi:hypothetical protein